MLLSQATVLHTVVRASKVRHMTIVKLVYSNEPLADNGRLFYYDAFLLYI
jgi:hypothetical protein